jgi:ABC-type lipoprotein release transport system permease subunit
LLSGITAFRPLPVKDPDHVLVRSQDKDAFLFVEPLEENVRRMLEPARMGAWFSGTVSLLALVIAATGIYCMLSYHVVERTSEIGIRMALGAQRRNVLLLIVSDGMKLARIGTAIGLAVQSCWQR